MTADKHPKGQAALLSVLFIFVLGFLTVDGVSNVTIGNIRTATDIQESAQTYYVAEAALEDALLRSMNQDYYVAGEPPASTSITLNDITATTTITPSSSTIDIDTDVVGGTSSRFRKLSTHLIKKLSTADFENGVQAGEGGIEFFNSSTVIGNVYSNGPVEGNSTEIEGSLTVKSGYSVDSQIPISEQDDYSVSHVFADSGTRRDMAQRFYVDENNKQVVKAEMYLQKVSTPTADLDVRIVEDDGGKPDTSDIGEQELDAASVSNTAGWLSVAFEDPPEVDEGYYWLVIDAGSSSVNKHFIWYHDGEIPNDPVDEGVNASNWSNSSTSWVGVGGELAHRIYISDQDEQPNYVDGIDATGFIYADSYTNSTAGPSGLACPYPTNDYCQPGDTTGKQDPVDDEQIENWECAAKGRFDDDAGQCLGGSALYVCTEDAEEDYGEHCDSSGNLKLSLSDVLYLETPLVVPGDLIMSNSARLYLKGPIWVKGDLKVSNTAKIILTSGFEDYENGIGESIVVGDPGEDSGSGEVTLSNGAQFEGIGDANIIVASKNQDQDNNSVIVQNTAGGDLLLFAPDTSIRLSNGADLKAAIGYRLRFSNSAQINYDSALSEFATSSGFSAWTWQVTDWKEIE